MKKHYNNLWRRSLKKFENDEFEYDYLIDAENDNRYGITLLARPSDAVKQNIAAALDEIRSIAPDQYYYPAPDLHITVLSIISCTTDFSMDDIDPSAYKEAVQSAVRSVSPFTITFRGLTASPSCILVQGYPEGNQLSALRDNLRDVFKASDLQHSIDKRYRRQTAHMTIIRFKKQFENTQQFVDKVSSLRDKNFGSSLIERVELVGNDWYQQQEKTESIAEFTLE